MFDVFLREAVEPFVLDTGESRIVIAHPPSASVAALDLVDTPLSVLRVLLDAGTYAQVRDLFAAVAPAAVAGFVGDVRAHFGLAHTPRGGWAPLVDLINRYGDAVEFDLFDRGWDILDFFRGVRPWSQVSRLVDKLPPLSHTRRAIADDDELARLAEQASGGKPAGPVRPVLAHWTEMDDLRATLVDGFALVQLAIASANTPKGKSPPRFRPSPRPKTAWQRAEARRDAAVHQEIVAQLLPTPPD